MKNISNYKKKAGIYLTTFLLLASCIYVATAENAVTQEPIPSHVIWGYANYAGGGAADGATVTVSSSVGTKTTVVASGSWQVDTGDPIVWPDGTVFTVDITQNGAYPNKGWHVTASDSIAGNQQNMGTLILSPPAAPSTPSITGDTTGYIGDTISLSATSSDPSSQQVRYTYDDGNGGGSSSAWMSSGTGYTFSVSYSTAGIYDVTVSAENEGAQSSSDGTHTIQIFSNPPADPSAPTGPSSGTHGTSYTFSATTTDPDADDISYQFDWDDGTTSSWTTPVSSGTSGSSDHTWDAPGTYSVRVKAKDTSDSESNWSPTASITIANTAPPTPNTPTGPSSGTHGTSYTYTTDTVTDPEGDPVEYKFSWGDGSDSGWISTPSASHTYTDVDTFQITAASRDAWDESTASAALSVTMTNQAPDTPSIPSGSENGATQQTYSYSTTVSDPDGDPLEYLFDWDDGSDSGWISSSSASHSWNTPGTYDVKVKVQDNWDESGWSPALTVTIVQQPTADAGGPYEGIAGQELTMSGSVTGGTQPYGYTWDLGDGTTLTGQTITYTYATEGTYTVSLTVMDSTGITTEDTTTATIQPAGSIVASAGGPYTAEPDETIQFTGSVTGGDAPYTWHWDLGDGSTSDVQNPTHIYTTIGTYTATLTVTDAHGLIDTDTATVTIYENHAPGTPTIDGPSEGKYNTEYTFEFTATDPDGDDIKFLIDWGDDTTEETITIASGETVQVSHTWAKETTGTIDTAYLVKAKTIDTSDVESDWGTMDITMPYTFLDMLHNFLGNLMEQFPLLEWLLSLPVFTNLIG